MQRRVIIVVVLMLLRILFGFISFNLFGRFFSCIGISIFARLKEGSDVIQRRVVIVVLMMLLLILFCYILFKICFNFLVIIVLIYIYFFLRGKFLGVTESLFIIPSHK